MKREKVAPGFLLLLVLLAAIPVAGQSQTTISADQLKKVEAVITEAVSKQNIGGFSAAIVNGNRLRWSKGFGWADVENRVVAQPLTVYRLASVSKPITAVSAMHLVKREKLDLDAPLQSYCPAFPAKPWKMTARQLLGHLSGIRHYKADENFNSTRHYASVA